MNAPVQNFGDLTFDGMVSMNADKDRNTQLRIGVYRGRATIAIFQGERGQTGGPKARLGLSKYFNVTWRRVFEHVRKKGPDNAEHIPVRDWDPTEKKMKDIGKITLGIDSTGMPYLGFWMPDFPATKFPIRNDMKMDVSGIEGLNAGGLAIDTFLAAMDNTVNAINLTSFRFDPSQRPGGGGNRGGYSGGNRGPQQSSSGGQSSRSTDVDDEIPF